MKFGKFKPQLKIAAVIITYLMTLLMVQDLKQIPGSFNLFLVPIIMAGFLSSTTFAVILSVLSSFYVFSATGFSSIEMLSGSAITSLSLVAVAILSGGFYNYLKSKNLRESLEKNKLTSLHKVHTHFITSLEPATVYDQFVREVRSLMAVDASLLVKVTSSGSMKVLAEEKAEFFTARQNLVKLRKLIKELSVDKVLQDSCSTIAKDVPFASFVAAPVINNHFVFLFSKKSRILTDDEIALFKDFLDEAHLAFSGAQFYTAKEKQSKLIGTISELNKMVNSLTETDELIYHTLRKVSDLLSFDYSVFVTTGEEQSMILSSYEKPGLPSRRLRAIVERFLQYDLNAKKMETQIRPVYRLKTDKSGGLLAAILEEGGFHAGIFLPVVIRNRTYGAIIGFYVSEPFNEVDYATLEAVSSEISTVFYSSRLISQIKNLTLKTLESVSLAFDSISPYTKGHSVKVAKYATAIAKELGLSFKQIREIQYAALLHDFGRIFIDREILHAPRKLTREEMEKIRRIPVLSSKIFERVNFFNSIIPLIYHHKEHFDGSGYPAGLKGKEIPLGSRIILAAEAFVAMTSERPHRPALDLIEAVREMQKGAGKQFDPEVVEALLKVVKSEYPSHFVDLIA